MPDIDTDINDPQWNGDTSMSNEDFEHRGDFAEGEAKEHVKPGTLMGDFAAGQEEETRSGTVQPKGDFATGEEESAADPAGLRGDFARGQEQKTRK